MVGTLASPAASAKKNAAATAAVNMIFFIAVSIPKRVLRWSLLRASPSKNVFAITCGP